MQLPDINDVKDAAEVIKPYIHHTPVIQSQSINDLVGHEVFFKCENIQRTGAFKIRGAAYAIVRLLQQRENISGVITHSSGNHAAALACAAQINNLACEIVMPADAPKIKQQAVMNYGAHITLCDPGMEARQSMTSEMMAKNQGLRLIHPYDDPHVITGQATATLEFIQQVKHLQAVVLPVGGGGLISGASIVMRSVMPEARLIGVEPELVGEAGRSIADGRRYPATGKKTIADGLQAGIGELNFAMIQQGVQQLVCVTEQQIKTALRLILERLKVVVEPSAAVPLAALLAGHFEQPSQRIGMILTGGNIDLDNLSNLI